MAASAVGRLGTPRVASEDSTYTLLVGEIQLLTTVLRRNRKWKTDPLALVVRARAAPRC